MSIRKQEPLNICNTSLFSQSPINFLLKIKKRHPYLNLRSNSLLALAVSIEYKSIGSTNARKIWPEDICGFLEKINQRIENQLRKRNELLVDPKDREYNLDSCMTPFDLVTLNEEIVVEGGIQQPGSLAYSLCDERANPFERLFEIDWTSYFDNPLFPSFDDDSIPDDIRERAEDMLLDLESISWSTSWTGGGIGFTNTDFFAAAPSNNQSQTNNEIRSRQNKGNFTRTGTILVGPLGSVKIPFT